jgi:hypothetical protein
MGYSVNQINNLLRTYHQQLKVKPSHQGEDMSVTHHAKGADQGNFSSVLNRLLEADTGRKLA